MPRICATALPQNAMVSCKINTSRVSVYRSGFALYETDMGVTVFRVEDCGAYVYHSVEDEEQFMPEETFSSTKSFCSSNRSKTFLVSRIRIPPCIIGIFIVAILPSEIVTENNTIG